MFYSDITPRTNAYADLRLLTRAKINNTLGRWGQNRVLPTKKTQTINFRRYEKLNSDPVVLAEGVTPAGQTLTATDYSCTLHQYGDFIRLTDVIQDTHEDSVLNDTMDNLGDQADEMIDKVRAGVLEAGSNILYTNGTAITDVNSVITRDLLRTAARTLKGQEAKQITEMVEGGAKINTYPIPACYIAVCHSDLQPDIERLEGFKSINEYSSQKQIFPGEFGSVGEFRFIFDNNLTPSEDGGGTYNGQGYSTLSTTGSASDVYMVLIFAKDAYGVVALAGKSGVQTLVSNPKAQAGDELAQKGSAGWKAWSGAIILNDAWMLRIDTAAKG